MLAEKTRYRIEGMDCASCAMKIETAVRRVDGVADVAVSVTAGTMTVEHSGADLPLVERRVAGLGYGIVPLAAAAVAPASHAHAHTHAPGCDHDHAHDHEHD
ncbi:MAG: cation transporter, partial [Starkeya sp.]|nr:cation transporter [Starkeya sp.]